MFPSAPRSPPPRPPRLQRRLGVLALGQPLSSPKLPRRLRRQRVAERGLLQRLRRRLLLPRLVVLAALVQLLASLTAPTLRLHRLRTSTRMLSLHVADVRRSLSPRRNPFLRRSRWKRSPGKLPARRRGKRRLWRKMNLLLLGGPRGGRF
ncbi:hypothetical protein SAICODRAFT_31176, partial [Saitoella complicata NRRL Y-17804]|uniref:uncharacterized protein n=1 Tax=Saitoella complicata (strain BCRC 22490 / CBS 7301 / JCM 7358 / NBRC 10748 / NRRL Y-17804) TaxID=698492 RepID=UPI000866965A